MDATVVDGDVILVIVGSRFGGGGCFPNLPESGGRGGCSSRGGSQRSLCLLSTLGRRDVSYLLQIHLIRHSMAEKACSSHDIGLRVHVGKSSANRRITAKHHVMTASLSGSLSAHHVVNFKNPSNSVLDRYKHATP